MLNNTPKKSVTLVKQMFMSSEKKSFHDLIHGDQPVLVDFSAEWCGPCKQFGPIFETASENHTDVTFGKVDTEAQQELAGAAGITSIPTLMAFRDGVLVFSQPGALPAPALEQVIEGVKNLDMVEVHKQVAEQQAAAEAGATNEVPAS